MTLPFILLSKKHSAPHHFILGVLALVVVSTSGQTEGSQINTARATHFLSQASMGGSVSEIDALAVRIGEIGHLEACEEWIDTQFALPRGISLNQNCTQLHSEDGQAYNANSVGNWWDYSWWDEAVSSEEQLRHRIGFALSQIAVVSDTYWEGLFRSRYLSHVKYYDRLMEVAFTSHRDFLYNITYSPMMGVWLSHAQNSKGNEEAGIFPDENFAREILQLFSMGVYSQYPNGEYVLDFNNKPVENYDNDDIREFAKVFTGLSINDQRGFFSKNLTLIGNYPMQMQNDHHHTGEKKLFNGVVLPAGQGGNTDIVQALDNIAYHPSTAPNFSRLLIKRLTSSNPSPAYLKRVTDSWYGSGAYGTGVEGDFKAVIKAILLDSEARNAISYTVSGNTITATPTDPLRAKIKEPILKMTQFLRFASPVTHGPTTHLRLHSRARGYGQEILGAATVFNFYDADYSPPGGAVDDYLDSLPSSPYQAKPEIFAPEAQILSQNVVFEHEIFKNIALSDDALSISLNGRAYTTDLTQIDLIRSGTFADAGEILQHLNLYLCNGQLPSEVATVLSTKFPTNGASNNENFAQLLTHIFSSAAYSVSY